MSTIFRKGTKSYQVEQLYNQVVNNKVDIAQYVKKGQKLRNPDLIDTNRFTSYVFAETQIKPTTIERVLRTLREYDRV